MFELRGEAVGTLRMMPVTHGLTLTEQLLESTHPGFRTEWPEAWDAGRLVVAPQYRVGQEVVRRCLWLALEYMIEHTNVRHLLGSCTHVLSRLYRRFGFEVVGRDVPLPGTEKTYSLIHGTVEDVYRALAPTALEREVEERLAAEDSGWAPPAFPYHPPVRPEAAIHVH